MDFDQEDDDIILLLPVTSGVANFYIFYQNDNGS